MGAKTNNGDPAMLAKDVPGPGMYNPATNAFSTIAFS